MIGLIDPATRSLGGWQVAGGPPGLAMLLDDVTVPLDHPAAVPALLARADGPLLVRDAAADADDTNRRLAAVLDASGLVGTPLVTAGGTLGVLIAPDRRGGEPLEPDDGPLLFTVGSLLAGGIESRGLHAELEAQNRFLETRVAERTSELLAATAEAQEAAPPPSWRTRPRAVLRQRVT